MDPERFGLSYAGKAAALARALGGATAALRADPARSIRFERARDVLVEGDNLEALKLMRPAYTAAVQAIYIDPPYNTGHDFVYRDRFAEGVGDYLVRSGQVDAEGARLVANPESHGRYHSRWLAMMEPRLRVAHELLADDGLLFVSIDDHEVHHLRVLLDEIFGAECFIAQIVVVTNRGGRDYLRVATTHEYLLCYGKQPDTPVRSLPRQGPPPRHRDARGPYELRELRNRNPRFSPANRPNLFYPIFVDPRAEDADGLCPVSLEPGPGWEQVEPRNREGAASVWRWGQPRLRGALGPGDAAASEVVARRRRDGVFNIYEKHRATTTKARSVWDEPALRSEQGTRTLRDRLGVAAFDHPKPVELVGRCLRLATDPDGLVLDFFAGSGTTAEAVHALNAQDGGRRRYVLVQLPEILGDDAPARALGAETIADVTRLRTAATTPAEQGLRCFGLGRPGQGGDPIDAWSVALASGLPLDARIEPAGPQAVRLRAEGRTMIVSHHPALTRAMVEAWGATRDTAIACVAGALDDELAYNLARRHRLLLL